MTYKSDLTDAMTELGKIDNAVFVGQGVRYGGQAMFPTFEGVPMEKRIEFPVAEDLQLGFCTGLALAGQLPICIYPRMDFLLLALNQLVNHLDKLPAIAGIWPKIIIRVAVGGKVPFDPGPQHTQDHGPSISKMLSTVWMRSIEGDAIAAYRDALAIKGSAIVIEHTERYNT